MSKVAAAANAVLNYHTRGTVPAAIQPHVGLLTSVASETEVSGNNYARVEAGAGLFGNAAASGAITNTDAVTFPTPSDSWGDVVGWGIWTALVGGSLLRKTYLTDSAWFAFTAVGATNTLFAPGHTFFNNDRVVLRPVGQMAVPGNLSFDTTYYVVNVNGNAFQLAATSGGSAIVLSSDGAGRVVRIKPQSVPQDAVVTFDVGALVLRES